MDKFLFMSGLGTFAIGALMNALAYMDDCIGEGLDVKSVPYREFADNVSTGDLIFTSSTSNTSITRMITHSLWSHVGIAYHDHNGRLYEWSSHNEAEGITNSLGITYGGPQLIPMENLVAESGTIFWKQVRLTDAQRRTVRTTIKQYAYKLGFSSYVEFASYFAKPLASMFSGYKGGMACSHIVATTCAAAGAIEIDKDIAAYTPQCLSDTGDAKWLVPVGTTKMVVGFDATSLVALPQKIGAHV